MVDLVKVVYVYVVIVFELIIVVFFLINFMVQVNFVDVSMGFYEGLIEEIIVVSGDNGWLSFFDVEKELFQY